MAALLDTGRHRTPARDALTAYGRHPPGEEEQPCTTHPPPPHRNGPSHPALSHRERKALQHIADGRTYAATARRIGICVHTVDGYLRRIRAKSGARTHAELIRPALLPERPGH
ncbi:response regulator transcription factor [Streptomyces sp. NPDC050355]|uniref:response regulator transcription factor n=1 Tax=Streptomyces sp. NPDC050355 TaxID=3365609 RepID=UPI0037B10346